MFISNSPNKVYADALKKVKVNEEVEHVYVLNYDLADTPLNVLRSQLLTIGIKIVSQVLDALGEPIKAYGEETSRGRRRHVRY